MKTGLLVPQPGRNLKGMLAVDRGGAAPGGGLLLASVLLPPLDAPVHVLNAPSAAASQAPNSKGVTGTLASFTALFPEMVAVYLPTIVR